MVKRVTYRTESGLVNLRDFDVWDLVVCYDVDYDDFSSLMYALEVLCNLEDLIWGK